MKLLIKMSIGLLLLVFVASCDDASQYNKVELLKNITLKKHNIALLETNHNKNTQWLLARQDGVQILKSLQTYVLHKPTKSKNFSIQLLIDGKVEKELFFSSKPRWFTAHELSSEPFEEASINSWMFLPVMRGSNSSHAIYSRNNNKDFTYKEPHFIHLYQGQTRQIEAKYIDGTIIWNKVYYRIKPSAISKELKRAYNLTKVSSMQMVPLSATVKIDKGNMEVLQWERLANNLKKDIERELNSVFWEGDIIFQTSTSAQSKAIQMATNSQYSHLGIIHRIGADYFVYEAVQPVKLTPLKDWIARGKDGHYVIKRLKNADILLTDKVLAKMKQNGKKYIGKDYDLYFEWSDKRMYCSELVWKIYKEALGIEIGELSKLSDFNLSHPIVKKKLKERYGKNIPTNELVISPVTMFNSDKLKTIFSN